MTDEVKKAIREFAHQLVDSFSCTQIIVERGWQRRDRIKIDFINEDFRIPYIPPRQIEEVDKAMQEKYGLRIPTLYEWDIAVSCFEGEEREYKRVIEELKLKRNGFVANTYCGTQTRPYRRPLAEKTSAAYWAKHNGEYVGVLLNDSYRSMMSPEEKRSMTEYWFSPRFVVGDYDKFYGNFAIMPS